MTRTLHTLTATGLTAALALTLAACNRDTPTADGTGGAGGGKTLTLAVSTLNNPFFIDLRDGAQQAATAAGATLNVVDPCVSG